MTQGFFKQPISLQTWQDKFQLKNKIGNNVDESIEDTFNRVATQLSYNAGEKEIFFKLLMENKFVPAGRILANIGAGYHKPGASPINCIVSRMIPDSMEGIMQALKEAANVLQRGSGIGYDFSSIRPKGAIVNGVGAATSGPLSFMSIYDKMCKTIQSAGGRRGAQMGIMDCQHPDIEDFVVAKQTDGAYRQFNLSVNMTKNFINAVKNNADWDLWFWEKTDDTPPSDYEIKIVSKGALPFNYPEYTYFRFEEGFHHDCEFDIHTYLYKKKVYKTLKAVDLFNLITKSAYDYAEPGCLIVDNSNRLNNLWFLETLRATNPCVTGDTWINTADGPRQVNDLINKDFTAMVNGKSYKCISNGFFHTGKKPVYEITTNDGRSIKCTDNHPVEIIDNKGIKSMVEVKDLKIGMNMVLNETPFIKWDSPSETEYPKTKYTMDDGYVMGLLIGGGYITDGGEKYVLSLYEDKKIVIDGEEVFAISPMINKALEIVKTYGTGKTFDGWVRVKRKNNKNNPQLVMSTVALAKLGKSLGMSHGNKVITPEMEKQSSDFTIGLLKGLFDTDGTVQGDNSSKCSIRFSQIHKGILQSIQRMLLRLGITSKIYYNRYKANEKLMPDGKGGQKLYKTQACHELIIQSRINIEKFDKLIGFRHLTKNERLKSLLNQASKFIKVKYYTDIVKIEKLDAEDVYDCTIENIHKFDANGYIVHNCSEQNLPPYGACLLGSLNLVQFCTFVDGKYVITEENKIDFKRSVRVANLMLHRVVPFANLPYQQHMEEMNSKRRHGLGFTGLGSLLAMMNIKYDSQEALEIAEYFSKTLARESYLFGIELAETGDCAPVLSTMYPISGETYTEIRNTFGELISSELVQNGYVKGSVLMALSKYLKNVLTTEELYSLAVNGCAYTHATSIAPAGTISLLSNNVSNGIEPIFSPVYERNVIDKKDGSKRIEPVMDYAYQLLSETGSTYMDIFKTTANTISVDAHIAMMEVVQKYIDSSISKTINIDTDYPFEDFKEVYLKCYNAGLKGVSVFRFNPNFSSGVLLDKNTLAKHDYEFTTKSGKVYKLNGAEKVMYKGKEFYAATLHTELKEKSI